tara:strand:+ start:154 stop:600 length:447 start_codon:yes stop_codon:yes gene_type:complete
MANSMLSTLAALSIVFHALLGCCYHHTHAHNDIPHHEHKESSQLTSLCLSMHATAWVSHNHTDTIASNSSHNNPENHEHDHIPCEESSCTYVSSSPIELTALVKATSLEVAPIVTSINVSTTRIEYRRDIPVNSISTSMRLRKQVWLV